MAAVQHGAVKSNFKKKPWQRPASSNVQSQRLKMQRSFIAREARKAATKVATKLGELKYYDSGQSYAQVDRGGSFNNCSNVSQGVAQSDRVGDAIVQKFMTVAVDAYYNLGVTNVGYKLRIVVFRWLVDTASSAPSLGALFDATSVGTYLITCARYNWTDKRQKEFFILSDETFALNPSTDLVYRKKIDLKNYKQFFQPGASTGMGQIYVLLVADDATGAHVPDIQAQAAIRLYYTDA